jgi:hypothetical protein
MTLRDAGRTSMAYYYFDFKDVNKQNLQNLLPSLLIQLSARSDTRCVLTPSQRSATLREAHDDLGHKGYCPTLRTLLDRFWWLTISLDVKQYIATCHECQIRQTTKVRIPPTVAIPAPLFHKVYIDTMLMPPAAGYRYIVQARCSLSAWPEWRALRTENAPTFGAFIFEDIPCRWGAVEEIVTDNGTAYVAALDWLAERYGIRHIRISPYNSRANGIVERQHRTIRESIIQDLRRQPVKMAYCRPSCVLGRLRYHSQVDRPHSVLHGTRH